ncbi:Hypothetical protein I595_2339 [Croceitalea dokdonensis DOKDO 023]|uniref:Orotate phosphoribosyltransferase n=1 Tax=Croceitalea dokdonensis DOKDO 023 TaxID=1300341 RepID=A0A0P7B1I9_9FLAO|nr:hypothetical protein [Croceitalea dokdonensis]KPM31839.1 Hypothetical protein I595_2339 [Croceitalea dokdonensis DOKDO 023]
MHIEIDKKLVQKPKKEVFDFLLDVKNFEQLMPDNIAKFEVLDADTFRFGLSGMPEIVLKQKNTTPNDQLVYGAASDKLPFTLTADLISVSDGETEVVLSFTGEFNAMMAMMIKTPITNFMETLSNNLAKIT